MIILPKQNEHIFAEKVAMPDAPEVVYGYGYDFQNSLL